MFNSVLIANRGEIAVRIARTARRLGMRIIAVYSDVDRDGLHVASADEAYRIGPAPAAESYLNIEAIIDAAVRAKADAVHPGYGFLAENPTFVEACEAAGLTFVGPPAAAIRTMGLKDAAKRVMEAAGVPIVPGYHGGDQTPDGLAREAERIGYPILIKARAGGGGKGMRRVATASEFAAALAAAQREALASFADDHVIIERFVSKPRHIEVQVFADAHGNALHVFERDCSLQRRHQKVIEEAPAPGISQDMRAVMGEAAVKAARAVGYQGAGTVEFIVDASAGLSLDRFYFMEMNTRLQVEHPVTEAITGHDLVDWQFRVAAGELFELKQSDLMIRGHAFEARLYAEDAERDFVPATGRLRHLRLPERQVRVDTGVREGDEISPYYDPMIAKLIVHGPTRHSALKRLARALAATRVAGCTTNVAFLNALARHPRVVAGDVDTGLIEQDIGALVSQQRPTAPVLAVAALAALGLIDRSLSASTDPWDTLVAWRQWGTATQHVHLTWRGETLDISVSSGDGQSHDVVTPAGAVSLVAAVSGEHLIRTTIDGMMREFAVVQIDARVFVWDHDTSWTFDLPDRLNVDGDEAASEDRVTAPLPGQVKAVAVRSGDTVAKGDALIIVEAMKMEHTLTAPHAGQIAQVLVAAGDLVEDGQVLVRFEAPSASQKP